MDRARGINTLKWYFIYPINYGYIPDTISRDEYVYNKIQANNRKKHKTI